MGYVAVDKLQQGMVLSEDVRDIKSRLLLSKGQKIGPSHLRVLKIWGITEVRIVGQANVAADKVQETDCRVEARVKTELGRLLKNQDLRHPVIQEIQQAAVAYRCQHDQATPEVHILADDPGRRSGQGILNRLQRIEIKLPEAPFIIAELNEAIADPFATSNDVAQVVNKSPSLATLLLRVVNSAYYGFPSRIDRISRAVTIIGTKEISGLALAISVMQSFADISPKLVDMPAFIRHSLACGMIARILAALNDMYQTEQLFISGLLHDIGKLIVYKYFPDHALACQEASLCAEGPVYDAEKEILSLSHAQIGRFLLKKWKLPATLENDIAQHHAPLQQQGPLSAVIVQMADLIANSLGIGHSGERIIPALDHAAWEKTGITANTIRMIVRQAVHQLGPLEAALNG